MYLQWTKLISTVLDVKDITLDLSPSLPLFLLSATNERGHAKYPFHGRRFVDRGTRPWIEREGVKGLFQGVSEAFQKADAVVINLECPLTERHTPVSKKFVFRGDPHGPKPSGKPVLHTPP